MAKVLDISAETKILLAFLYGKDKVKSRILLELPTADYFGYSPTREIYERILSLRDNHERIPKPDIMASDPVLSEEAVDLLRDPGESPPTSGKDILSLIDILTKYKILRDIADTVTKVSEKAEKALGKEKSKGDPIEDILLTMEDCLVRSRTKRKAKKPFSVGYKGRFKKKQIKEILKKKDDLFIPTCMEEFDVKNRGFRRGQVSLLIANSGGMKTTLSEFMALHQYMEHGLSVAFLTFEMEEAEVKEDMSAMLTGIKADKVGKGELSVSEAKRIIRAWEEIDEIGKRDNCELTVFSADEELTSGDIEALLVPGKFDVWYVDYINLMKHQKRGAKEGMEGELWQKLGEIVRDFKLISKRNKIAVVLLAQGSEGGHINYAKKGIRENADNILYWDFREEHRGIGPNGSSIMRMETLKARRTDTMAFYLEADPRYKSFKRWEGEVPDVFEGKKKKRKSRTDDDSMDGL